MAYHTRSVAALSAYAARAAAQISRWIEARRTARALRNASPETREDLGLSLRDIDRLAA